MAEMEWNGWKTLFFLSSSDIMVVVVGYVRSCYEIVKPISRTKTEYLPSRHGLSLVVEDYTKRRT